jgi:hypothetical protein
MNRLWMMSLVLLLIGLAVWSSLHLPGWVGMFIGAVFLAVALASAFLLVIGVARRQRVGRIWREFVDFLYGL